MIFEERIESLRIADPNIALIRRQGLVEVTLASQER